MGLIKVALEMRNTPLILVQGCADEIIFSVKMPNWNKWMSGTSWKHNCYGRVSGSHVNSTGDLWFLF